MNTDNTGQNVCNTLLTNRVNKINKSLVTEINAEMIETKII